MKKYKSLITDLDGTAVSLASDGIDVTDLTRNTIKRAQREGFKITCATGRSWYLAKPVIKSLGFDLPCIVEGGTRIIDPGTEHILWEKQIDQAS